MVGAVAEPTILGLDRGKIIVPTQTSCTIFERFLPSKSPQIFQICFLKDPSQMGNLMTPVALLRQSPKGSLVVWDLSCLEVEGDRKKTSTFYQKVSEDHTTENPTNNPYNSCMDVWQNYLHLPNKYQPNVEKAVPYGQKQTLADQFCPSNDMFIRPHT